jgi:hypothetical protein
MTAIRSTGESKPTICRWKKRCMHEGAGGLFRDATRGEPRAPLLPGQVAVVVESALHETLPDATHWSLRSMARASGVALSTMHRIWCEHALKLHRVESLKRFKDPRFIEKVHRVVGLYVSPPEAALVPSVDQKRKVCALDRTRRGLPGRGGTITRDNKRHGTTTLLTALEVQAGTVIGQRLPRDRTSEFIHIRRPIDRRMPSDFDLHIADNYAAHKTKAQAPRFSLHFPRSSASWLNTAETLFAALTKQQPKRGVFHAVLEPNQAIRDYGDGHNAAPIPFAGTANADTIIAMHERGKLVLALLH